MQPTDGTIVSTVRRLIPILASALILIPAAANADTISLGYISFDNLIPDGATPGVNGFDINNFTGATYSIGSDFPVITELTFQDAMLTLDGSAGPQVINLGDIAPGAFTVPSDDEFTDTETFTSAIFTATLSDTSLLLSDSSTFTAGSATISTTILPSIGTTLTAGTDLAVITVSDQAATPEPATGVTLGGALLIAGLIARRRRNTQV